MSMITPFGAVARGLLAATVGTAAMDAQLYARYRLSGGTSRFLEWEFGGIKNWDQASAPGKVGKRLIDCWTQNQLSDEWADLTNSAVHWGFGMQWGAVYGITAGSLAEPRVILGIPFGTFVWLFGYAVLPLGHFYKPIWQQDAGTLGKDLFSHLIYGTTTAAVFRLLER